MAATMTCASCSTTLDVGDPFCRNCGAKQTEQPAAPAVVGASDPSSHGVRRRLSVMFYDVVGSTELSTKADVEDLQLALTRFQTMAADAIRSYGGHPANTMGDGGMAYFGYPTAHEDDPVRAVSAGLAMLEELPALNGRIQAEIESFTHDFQIRVGIHTGTAVVGEVGSDHRYGRLAVGETLNQAARVESKAPVNTVAVSDVTAERIGGVVDLRSIGMHELKGLPEPVEIFAVERVRSGQGRAAASGATLTSLAGREELLAVVTDSFTEAAAGAGKTIVLRGEAGIGKSRLPQTLGKNLGDTANWIEIKGSAVMTQSPFFPIVESLREFVGADPTTSSEQVAELAREAFAEAGMFDGGSAGLIADFLSATVTETPEMSAEERRERVTDAIVDWVVAFSNQLPTVIFADDLHWFDPSTLDLLTRLRVRIATESILILGTARPEFESPWGEDALLVEVEPLGLEAISQIVEELAQGSDLTEIDKAELVRKSDGVPLFAEELALAAVNSVQAGGDGSTGVPSTLIELLQSRLDRLGSTRHCLQVAALVGDEFSAELAAAVINVSDLADQLSTLVDGRFLAQRGTGDRVIYSFRHALMQDAASDTMLRRQRRSEHLRIAQILESEFAGRRAGGPEILGHHYESGGKPKEASDCFKTAGGQAHARYALRESASYYRRAIGLLEELPEDAEREQRELDLQLEIGSVSGVAEGFVSPQTRAAYERAVELCRGAVGQPGQHGRHFEALQGLNRVLNTGTDFAAALAIAAELEVFAEENDNRQARLSAELAYGQVHFWQGRFGESAAALERARELYDPAAPEADRYAIGVEMGITTLIFSAYASWAVGDVTQSVEFADQAAALGDEQDDLYQAAHARTYSSIHAIMLDDPDRCEQLASFGRNLAQQHGFTALDGLSSYTLGWALAAKEDPAGIDIARAGVGLLAGIGAGLGAPGCMAVMAQICADAKVEEEGQAYVDFGFAMAAESSHDFYLAEIHRSAALIQLCAADRYSEDSDEEGLTAALAAALEAANRALAVAQEQGSPTLGSRAQQVIEEVNRRLSAEVAR